jgi:dolichyl-phosphate-mannose--protein O-mannosyl transferase
MTRTRASLLALLAILGAGLLVRLALLPSLGFSSDVQTFEAWTLTLKDNPPWMFYLKTSFADYPPGYFAVLWLLGRAYALLELVPFLHVDDGTYFALRLLVKLPAVAMDLVDAVLIYAIVRRYAREAVAVVAAALFALNPATIYVSAYWGQVDSVSWGFVLLAIWLALRAGDEGGRPGLLVWAWLAVSFSILIKPQGALVALVLLAYAFVPADGMVRARRLRATALGIGASVVLAYALTVLFHGSFDPIAGARWLFERYSIGSNVYAYNSVNAFNLYAVKQPFWQSDSAQLVLFGFEAGPTWLWGVVLVAAATALIVTRYLQERTEEAFLGACMLTAFAFFILATRMHERYIYGAFLLAFPLLGFGRRRLWAVGVLSVTTFLNLVYSLAYLNVMQNHPAGVDATAIWGAGSHLVAAANVVLFFLLGYAYLGGSVGALAVAEADAARLGGRARAWFDPREGIVAMTRLDWIVAGLMTAASFVICLLFIQWPVEKIFDEIYYARAGEEYLKHIEIFEFTHPPLTKLVITLSMMLFGGLSGAGDTGLGWRFLNVVVGALMVGVLYLFAKRLMGSSLFAAIAAGMLLLDGFHFVQSRIATPEITVAFFSLFTLYAFYRVWTASAARRARVPLPVRSTVVLVGAFVGAGAVVGALVATVLVTAGPSTFGPDMRPAAWVVAFLYVEVAFYLAGRWLAARRPEALLVASYADGSRIELGERGAAALDLPEGDRIAVAGAPAGDLALRSAGEAQRRYQRDGKLIYTTPLAAATFETDGTMKAPGGSTRPGEMWRWLAILAFAGGALGASKWNGLFDFFVVWFCAAGVVAQRYARRAALYGNPFGMPLDVVIGGMLVAGGAVYTLCYVPFFTLGHNFVDMVSLQKQMFEYHEHLVATHPYASQWWQWPILERPISYYYHDFRSAAEAQNPAACCVAEILALPNPFVWWFGLITVPAVGVLAWFERNRGYALLVVAYFLQWLPWIGSPRIAFEYHFFPNLALIVLCNAIVLQKLWHWTPRGAASPLMPRVSVGIYLAVVVWAFIFFYPVLVGQHVPWQDWHARMWIDRWII